MTTKSTSLLYLGRDPKKYDKCVNTPIYKSSTFIYESVEDFLREDSPFHTDATYGRSGTTIIHELEDAISTLEGADHTILTSSGMSAIILALLSFLQAGDHVLIPDATYKCTKRFVEEEFPRLGIEYTYYNPNLTEGIRSLIKQNTKAVYMESPSSGTFEIQDIAKLTSITKEYGLISILDNTWATPLFFQGMQHGVDVIVQSLSKYFSGHADVIMGAISYKNPNHDFIRSRFRNYGAIASPEDAYLVLRGLRTLSVRLNQHYISGMAVARWLEEQPYVAQVMHPALPTFKHHHLWKQYYTGAAGVFGVVLKKSDKEPLYKCINELKYFGIGLSWGGFESLIIPYELQTLSIRTRVMEGNYIRLNIGLESAQDLIDDLDKSLKNLNYIDNA
ncbi:MAG: cystathionine beta-lyase [Candidatus Jidaibacter sp.]|jgi:cystathionine beta-lyase|nr:cystathionine beta-lyase [Candidatus Jidaibacter sp.]